MESLFRDLHYALRSLAGKRGFTAAALITLALGTGAVAAIFSVIHAVLLEPLPFGEPDRLVTLWLHNPRQGYEKDVTSYPNFRDWREQGTSFSVMVGATGTRVNLTGPGADAEPEEVRSALVTERFFEFLDVAPLRGRGFRDADHQPGQHQVTVLSYGLWNRRFAADPNIVGREIRLNGMPYSVVGVMRPGVRFPEEAELWLPLAFTPERESLREGRSILWLPVYGRLAPDVTLAAAQNEMSVVARRLEKAFPDVNREFGILLEPLRKTLIGDMERPLLLLLGAVVLVVMIACANVANLFLARGAGRVREFAVRSALGAGRGSLATIVLAESLLIGAGGGLLGLVLAALGMPTLLRLVPAGIRIEDVAIDWRVFAVAIGVALAAGALSAVPSILNATGVEPVRALREGGRGLAGGGRLARLRKVFVVAQLALALVLLAGSGLLIRSFLQLRAVDPGFEPRGVLTFRISLPGRSYDSPEKITNFYRQLLDGLSNVPGVRSTAAISDFGASSISTPVVIESRPNLSDADAIFPVAFDAVTPAFLQTAGIRLLRGRALDERDRADGVPVALVNEAFARRYFPGENATGRRFLFGRAPDDNPPWITIVGVIANARRSGLDQEVRPAAFLPYQQYSPRVMTVLVRTMGDPLALVEPARRAVRALDASQPVTEVRTLENLLASSSARRRFVAVLLTLFAGLAVTLAAVGIYGVMAYIVGQRVREIGIRVAMGARRVEIVRWVLGEGMTVVGAGVAVGLVAAAATTRFLTGLLYETAPLDAATFLVVAAVLAVVALAANLFPAMRASRVDPMRVLREE